ncbi:MAG: hemolysin III family protein [Acidobacteriota bacterium]
MIASRFAELTVEEVANSLTHGFGLLLSIAGFFALIWLAAARGGTLPVIASVIYGASLVTLYAASTFYHTAVAPELKKRLQILDHCCIYLLIAGSYTPLALLVFRDSFGTGLLIFAWTFAVFGIAIKLIFGNKYSVIGVISYLAMGWVGVLAVKPMYTALGAFPLALMVAGGVAYSLGVIFFGWHSIRHHHAIFHVFVLAGSVIHYFAIVFYVIPFVFPG